MALRYRAQKVSLSLNLFPSQRSAVNDRFEASCSQMPKTGTRIYECLLQRGKNLGKSRGLCPSQAIVCPVAEAQVLL